MKELSRLKLYNWMLKIIDNEDREKDCKNEYEILHLEDTHNMLEYLFQDDLIKFKYLLKLNIDMLNNIEQYFIYVKEKQETVLDKETFDSTLDNNYEQAKNNQIYKEYIEGYFSNLATGVKEQKNVKASFKKLLHILSLANSYIITNLSFYTVKESKTKKHTKEPSEKIQIHRFGITEKYTKHKIKDLKSEIAKGAYDFTDKNNVFLSHSFSDLCYVVSLFSLMYDRGIRLFVDGLFNDDLTTGSNIKEAMAKELKESDQLLLGCSDSSELNDNYKGKILRGWCSWEVGYYYSINKDNKYFYSIYGDDLDIDHSTQIDGFKELDEIKDGKLIAR